MIKMCIPKLKMKATIKLLALIGIMGLFPSGTYAQLFTEFEDYSSMQGIQTEGCSDFGGGLNVGYIDENDWLEYTIDIPMTGDYVLSVRAASLSNGGTVNVSSQGTSSGELVIPVTGGWQNWQTVAGPTLSLEQGVQQIRFTANSAGFNLNWFELSLSNPVDDDLPTPPIIVESTADIHTIALNWEASSDPTTTVTGYKIFQDNNFLAFANGTSFSLTKLAPETEFNLSISACDLAGNQSDPAALTIATTPITWEVVWLDEFNGSAVDNSKWNFQVGGDGWGNGEAQYYTNGPNSRVENGHLIIEARQETIGNNQYTSSRMNNANKGDFLYGRAEIRAKLPSTGGTWPAIWTLPTVWSYGTWPYCGEIDIMEHTGNNLNYAFGTIHTGAYNHQDGTAQSGGLWFEDISNSFHTYTLEWYPDHLDWYYDDQIIFTYENEYNSFMEWPFDIPHHILLNVAVGGGLGGNIDHNGVWPQQMEVDYVRIYDFDLGAGDTIAPSTPTGLQAEVAGISVDLSWTTSIDNEYVERYYIYLDNQLIDSVSGASPAYTVSFLNPLTAYTFGVQAKDFGGNVSGLVTTTATTEDVASIPIPGQFEAENYLYMQGMETETCTDIGGGLNMAYIDEGDWLVYYIDVENEGEYILSTRAASEWANGNIELINENDEVLTAVETPITGGWQNWETTVSENFHLDAGIQRIRIEARSTAFNLNWFTITTDPAVSIKESVIAGKELVYPNPTDGRNLFLDLGENASSVEVCIYTIEGKTVYERQLEYTNNRLSFDGLNLNSGVYLLTITREGSTSKHKLIVN
jgi:beta-glucanase (GH16 family)